MISVYRNSSKALVICNQFGNIAIEDREVETLRELLKAWIPEKIDPVEKNWLV
jgi:hypothetical protein